LIQLSSKEKEVLKCQTEWDQTFHFIQVSDLETVQLNSVCHPELAGIIRQFHSVKNRQQDTHATLMGAVAAAFYQAAGSTLISDKV
jgi:hypothetical protein